AIAVNERLEGQPALRLPGGSDDSFIDFHGFGVLSFCGTDRALQNDGAQSTASQGSARVSAQAWVGEPIFNRLNRADGRV
ncbi:MAG TPA: hypothetical protein VJA21_11105, partial [Verrucomicrobiae bacterium]